MLQVDIAPQKEVPSAPKQTPDFGNVPVRGFRLKDFRLLFRRLLLVVGAYSVSRIFFLGVNSSLRAGASSAAIAKTMALGLRFDISAALTINAPFIAITLLPLPWRERRGWRLGLKIWFVLSNTFFLLIDLADAEYVKFTGRRTGSDILGILPDMQHQLPQLVLHYFYVPLLAFALGYALWRLYSESIFSYRRLSAWAGSLSYTLIAGLAILGIRGTLNQRPLSPGNAYKLHPARLGTAALNTPFVFIKSLQGEHARTLTWAGSEARALATLKQTPAPAPIPQLKGYNVVVMVLESFATEYTGLEGGVSYTPFLDSLAYAGTCLPHFYANGRRSIEAMPAIFAQLPNLEEEALISGPYSSNQIIGWPAVAADAGYATAFFHGGHNGTMGFDHFSAQAGFDSYYGRNEYPNRADDDDNWGIFDRPFLQFASTKLSAMPQPFVAGIFTLSSHQPYTIEPGFEGQFPKGTLPVHESLGYADHALRRFFATAARQPWYKNTLFVLTADHTQQSDQPRFQTPAGLYDVPCVLFAPGRKLALDTSQVRQHADIGPTVLDLLGLKAPYLGPYAQSMARTTPSRVLAWSEGNYIGISNQGWATLTLQGQTASNLTPTQAAQILPWVKAGSQLYSTGLKENRLYP